MINLLFSAHQNRSAPPHKNKSIMCLDEILQRVFVLQNKQTHIIVGVFWGCEILGSDARILDFVSFGKDYELPSNIFAVK